MLSGSASILYGVARGELPTGPDELAEIGRAVVRDAMAARRRIDQAAHRLDFPSSPGKDGTCLPSESTQKPIARNAP
jgi:hypothetical protein